MKKKIFLIIILFGFFLLHARGTERAVISVLFSSDRKPYQQAWQGFKNYLEEKNITCFFSQYNLDKDNKIHIFSQIKKGKPDVLLTIGSKASKFAKDNIKNIPVIFSMVLNPDDMTGSNIAGVSMNISARSKLKELKRLFPQMKSIGLIYSENNPREHQEILKICRELNLELVSQSIQSREEFPKALEDMAWRINCFLMIPNPDIYFPHSINHLLSESMKKEFPVIGLSSVHTKAGALLSFDCDYTDLGRQAGELTLEVLSGKNPSELSKQTPRKLNLSLNMVAAKVLGIEIPQKIIKKATEVFEK
jgi:putative ABC transport system substrate-binding protein